MFRFFESEQSGEKIKLSKENYKHLVKSVRIGADEIFEVVTKSGVHSCVIDGEFAKIVNTRAPENEPVANLRLFQGLSKGHKFEDILNACTQAGVTSFVGVEMRRSVARINDGYSGKLERYAKILEEAAKQSKRDIIPEILSPIKFAQLKDYLLDGIIIVAYENELNLSLADALKSYDGCNVNLIIGPEGGFDDAEIAELIKMGAKIVTLGNRILRTEIAAIVTSFAIIDRIEERKINEV